MGTLIFCEPNSQQTPAVAVAEISTRAGPVGVADHGYCRAEADLVRRVAGEWLSQKRRRDFGKLHLAVQRRPFRSTAELGVAPDFDLTEQLRGSANSLYDRAWPDGPS